METAHDDIKDNTIIVGVYGFHVVSEYVSRFPPAFLYNQLPYRLNEKPGHQSESLKRWQLLR
ncbi:hypothetical protein M413DRAFT_128365 [Hebeloma cylindrosporum]|uniref:Uncharacterized protein n=1 Tax=Hebeloma cylindrosporum TaxID=76867 RepID=A0A0C2XWZ8_HEBCY|nr:hypothetical protein M413DRAFT_128365 [Hebeloma cylindrosporum h7]